MATYPEVIRIHMDYVRVLHAQGFVDFLDVVQVLHSSFQPTHHYLTMLGHFLVSQDGSVSGNVAKRTEVSLSPGIHNQEPGMT